MVSTTPPSTRSAAPVVADYALAETAIRAVMPRRRLVPPRVRAFVDYVAEQLGEHPPWEALSGHASRAS